MIHGWRVERNIEVQDSFETSGNCDRAGDPPLFRSGIWCRCFRWTDSNLRHWPRTWRGRTMDRENMEIMVKVVNSTLKNESYLLSIDHHYMFFSLVKQRSHQLLLPTSVSRWFVSATPGLLVPHPGRFHPRRAWTAPGIGPSWGRKWWRLDPTFTLYIYMYSHPK